MATLGEQAVGSIVKLNVNGTPWNFIVVHQGLPGIMYDVSCDGTWLLMEGLYESRTWDSSNNDYANSDIHIYLNNTFVNLLDSDIKNIIQQVKIPYTKGTGKNGVLATGSSGVSAKIFLLSFTETGLSGSSYANAEGAVLSYFNGADDSKRIAYLNGAITRWWLRSPATQNTTQAWRVLTGGYGGNGGVTNSNGVRPTLVLSTKMNVSSDGMVMPPSGAITGTVNINGVQRELTGEGYININGVLRELTDSQVNIGSTLKSLKG